MASMTSRSDLAGFLGTPENAHKLNGLMEDICYALMDYRVRTPKRLALVVSNICLRPRYNETSIIRAARI